MDEKFPVKTIFVGQVLSHFEELASTNEFALNLISKNNPIEGTAITTYNQTQGHGQSGSRWASEPDKNLAISIILYPKFLHARHQFMLSQAIALAVRNLIAKYVNLPVKVKWPNDIYINNKKISGILIQNSIQGVFLQHSIIGIGINVNQILFPEELPHAGSIAQFSSKTECLDEVRNELFLCVEQAYLQLKNNNFDKITNEYLAHLYRFKEETLFQLTSNLAIFSGVIEGIQTDGRLLVSNKNEIKAYELKEIKMLI